MIGHVFNTGIQVTMDKFKLFISVLPSNLPLAEGKVHWARVQELLVLASYVTNV